MRKIIHIDMDAFFASVEQRDRPELRGRPVIVGTAPQRRGVVSTCSYEARAYGVHSAMPSRTALRLCPQAVFIEPDFRKYKVVSSEIRRLFFSVTDLVEPMSIDEAYLDVTKNRLGRESAGEIARYLQSEIRTRTGLSASAGVSYNKFLAKVASDFRKPGGLTVIPPEKAEEFLDNLPVARFHGIGSVSAEKLRRMNIRTGHDLRALPLETLEAVFGKQGRFYYGIVRGIDDRPVELEGDPKSISREVTLYEDCTELRQIRVLLRTLARKVARRAKKYGFEGRSVTIKLKYADFHTVTRTAALEHPSNDGPELGSAAVRLLPKTEAGLRPVRLVGMGIGKLAVPGTETVVQLELDFKDSSGF